LNETFLNQAVEHIELEGYKLVARRDRTDGRSGGGIVAFANDSVFERATLIATSDTAERCWLLIHADQVPYLLCTWYRPPTEGEINTIDTFKIEFEELSQQALGTLCIGDINAHHRQWIQAMTAQKVRG